MSRLVKTGREVDEIVNDPRNHNRIKVIDKGNGNREVHLNEVGAGKINYNVDQTFSEPMSHFLSGVLRVFGLLIFIGLLAGVFWMVTVM